MTDVFFRNKAGRKDWKKAKKCAVKECELNAKADKLYCVNHRKREKKEGDK